MTLFERWEMIAARNPSAIALSDRSGSSTFADLQTHLASRPRVSAPIVVRGSGINFIAGTLNAWRDRQPLFPIESKDTVPEFGGLPDWVAHIKTTSGSTGSPRHILFREEQIAADVDHIVSTMGLNREVANLGAISLAHSYGFSNLVLPLLLHGIPLILTDTPLPEAIRRLLADVDQVALPGVPAMWRAWHDTGVISEKIAIAISAGAPLSTALERDVYETSGVKIHNFLGSSECGGIAYDRTSVPRDLESSWIGTALDGVTLDTAADGMLRVHSDAAGETYWPSAADTLGNGTFVTSDLADVSDAGVCLKGRATDVINVAGRKVDPADIENVLAQHPSVRHVVVFGMPSSHAERVEDIVAVLNAPKSELDSIKGHARMHLTTWKVPRVWKLDGLLAPDERGKISRAAWRKKTRL